ncbi:hypothetical protein BC939DRAFT_524945 [Gamsiella multidivaricata]|uniref:uncharacterized protein n=1 Tax=Gamsiella multidivaricata TaxID=101098 RepID=UPI00221F0D89|nr:uncharacterized protein BC939DRAFT_524945 [Gamsiella multidivaricata]KAG0366289.1 nucleotide exchange factor sil1 [Gamsiella multidivaricata]KAI7831356.1 hypothetical protein BC939DRAFT_524945 [Gamsiella multidivaricata]
MARITSKLTLVLGLCAALALANVANQAAVNTRPEVICNNGACYARVFRPTTEFQEVLEGQEIPSGLHVQMDFETHKKYAKLMDPEDVQNKDITNSILVVDTETPGTVQHQIGSNNHIASMPPPIDAQLDGEPDFAELEKNSRINLQTAFDSIPELAHLKNQDQKQQEPPVVPLGQQSHHQTFTEQLSIVKSSKDNTLVLDALEVLADLASDMDFGLRLSEGEGLKALVGHLHCGGKTDAECQDARFVRSNSALTIGTAVQNHEKAQSAAFKANLHKFLLARLETESDKQVLRRLIFAYGSLVRGSSNAFIQDEDISRLAEVYSKSTDALFKRKCVNIMRDFADPDMQFVSTNNEDATVPGGGDVDDRNETLKETMVIVDKVGIDVGPWCETLQQSRNRSDAPEDNEWEIVDRAVELLHASYPETCILTGSKIKDEL